MSFDPGFVQSFNRKAQALCDKHHEFGADELPLGHYLSCPYPPDAIMDVMDLWIQRIDKLIGLIRESSPDNNNDRIIQLYRERGVTYQEFFYLFSDTLTEEEYLHTPVYLFTKTFSKDIKQRRYRSLDYTPESYKDFILEHAHLVPAQFFNETRPFTIPISVLYGHTYCMARTRSGKTECLKLILHEAILNKAPTTSLLVLDPHGDFAREVKRFKVLGERIDDFVFLDPSLDSNYTPIFNPFDIESKDIQNLAYASDSILDAFQQLLKEQGMTGNMKRLMRHCIYALLYHDHTSMHDLLHLLQAISRNRSAKEPSFTERERLLMHYGKTVDDPLTKDFFSIGWRDVDARTINAVIERIDGILSHPLVRRFVVGSTSFSLESLLNTGKIVVVNLDFTKLGYYGSEAIGRLIVSEAQNVSARRSKLPKLERPRTLIIMDECQRFVSSAIEQALSEFAKFNTSLLLAHQYVEQIDDTMIKAMLSNTENKIIGRNSASSMGSITQDVGVNKEELIKLKKYEFWGKFGDRDACHFHTSSALVDTGHNDAYTSEVEAHKKVDPQMLERYYRPVDSPFIKPHSESGKMVIELDEDDF